MARQIVIREESTGKVLVVESDVTTLGQLKSAIQAQDASVSFNGKEFYEGITKTYLVNDEALLPHDVPYNGTVTNNLIIGIVAPKRKNASGSVDVPSLLTAAVDLVQQAKKLLEENEKKELPLNSPFSMDEITKALNEGYITMNEDEDNEDDDEEGDEDDEDNA